MPRSTDPKKNLEHARLTSADPDMCDDILSEIAAADSKLSPLDLQRRMSEKYGYDRRAVFAAVRQLTDEGELNYIEACGHTQLELSFNRPIRVSQQVILSPAGLAPPDVEDSTVVFLQHGAAFGDGRHPSTRLALQGIEVVIDELLSPQEVAQSSVLDVGTGTGVLVVAAVKLGFGSGLGLDTDPCAVSEATVNVRLNNLGSRIQITGQPVETITRQFALVSANLRWPTLKSLRHRIQHVLTPNGAAVFSGIRAGELDAVIEWYGMAGFECRWHRIRRGWASAILQPL
jgi:ribosomal protein L11 methylase PrmA